MSTGDIEELAGALNISDDDLATIQSRFKKKETQAHRLMCNWHAESGGSKQMLVEILHAIGYHEAAMQ